jgi:GTP-binding protein LepA
MENIKNFVIIAHIDHGKSTLADRFLEHTGTVENRRMKPQYLDQLELERERGITIKMTPVRMKFLHQGKDYILNLIDTPGHSDFSYEVSRALEAVEGAVLLVDATKGIQAQTLSNLRLARKAGLTVIGAVNKVDLNPPGVPRVVEALAKLLETSPSKIMRISGKTGEGVPELLARIAEEVPSPAPSSTKGFAGLIFDSLYDDHKGILAYVRGFGGDLSAGSEIRLAAAGGKFKVKEVGYFLPELKSSPSLREGEIGYIATGLKEPSLVKIGDTVVSGDSEALPGYREPKPVVFISYYPDGNTKFEDLHKALERLHLNDPALSFEPDSNEALGRGMKVGFLGQLHFEITSDRLRREFGLEFMTSFPSIAYRVRQKGKEWVVKQSEEWPERPDEVFQPMIRIEIMTPSEYLNQVLSLKNTFEMEVLEIENMGDNLLISVRMPLSELIRDFDDQLKSSSAGYASFSYELDGEEIADVSKMEIMVGGEVQPALTRIISRKDLEREARQTVERLKKLLPQEQFAQAIQARVENRILARETIAAMKKTLGDFGKNGGERTRKMKLWRKQKRGKEKLKGLGRVSVPVEVFREILKK